MLTVLDTLDDEADDLRLGGVIVEFACRAIVHGGDEGCWRDADGHGCPPLPPEVVTVRIDVIRVVGEHGDVAIDDEQRRRIADWVERHDDYERVEGRILAEALIDG